MSNLDAALSLAARGYTPLILSPLTKYPKYRGYFDSASRDAGRIAERYRETVDYAAWIESKRSEDFAHFRDPATGKLEHTAALAASQVDDYTAFEPNVGLYIGASDLVVIDVDSPKEYEAWLAVCEAHGFDPGPPTVQSPGAFRNGVWVHREGGHWYYFVPSLRALLAQHPSLSNVRIGAAGFLSAAEVGQEKLPAFMTNKRLVVVPPSARVEGHYNGNLSVDPPPLPPFLMDMVSAHVEREQAKLDRRPRHAGIENPDLIDWEAALEVTDLLDGWEVSGTDDGCEVLEHPEASTSRSAVVHTPRCRHHQADTDHRLVTFHTVTRPEWVENALDGRTSCAVSTLFAHKHYDGSVSAMKRALGFRTQAWSERTVAVDIEPVESAAPQQVASTMVLSRPRRASRALEVTPPPPRRDAAAPAAAPEPQLPAAAPTESGPPAAPTGGVTTVPVDPEPAPATSPPETPETPEKPAARSPKVVSPKPKSKAKTAKSQAVDAEPLPPTPEDTWQASSYDGQAPEWSGVNPLSTLYTLLSAIAVEPPSSTIAHLGWSQVELSKPAPLRATEEERKDYTLGQWRVRKNLHDRHRIVTTVQLADKLGVPPPRVRAWMRVLMPVAETRGLIIRERINEAVTKQRARDWNASLEDGQTRCLDYGLPTASVDTAWLVFRTNTTRSTES